MLPHTYPPLWSVTPAGFTYAGSLCFVLFHNYLHTFLLRSAMYTEGTGECRLAAMDRHSLAGRPGFQAAEGVHYMEVNCVSDPTRYV